ncbi:hypothetical protein, partial [Gordonia sp. NPDC003376]
MRDVMGLSPRRRSTTLDATPIPLEQRPPLTGGEQPFRPRHIQRNPFAIDDGHHHHTVTRRFEQSVAGDR